MPKPAKFGATKATGIAVGFNKGHVVTHRQLREKPSNRKGRLGDRVKLIRGVIREVTGYAPYEKRLMEILRGGGNNPTKKAWKFAKNRLGTHIRAKRKVVEMGDVIASAKRAEAAAKAAAKAESAAAK